MAKIEKPSRINAVSVTVVLIILGLAYTGVQFGPGYLRKWEARSSLDGFLMEYYRKRHVDDKHLDKFLEDLSERAEDKLYQIGIDDQDLIVDFDRQGDTLIATTSYEEVVRHPLINKVTRIRYNIVRKKKLK
jgi:hypothetical protein